MRHGLFLSILLVSFCDRFCVERLFDLGGVSHGPKWCRCRDLDGETWVARTESKPLKICIDVSPDFSGKERPSSPTAVDDRPTQDYGSSDRDEY
jgi:hypothetical protein